MSNFSIFSQEYLQKLLEPFAPGMVQHITPIKYDALTPDCFLLLFRTTGSDNDNHYFVSLETDTVDSLVGAECIIDEWHGQVIDFWPLHNKRDKRGEKKPKDIDDYKVPTSGPYFAMLAEVKKPTQKGYWAEATIIMPGDDIGAKIKHYAAKEQANIRKALENILQHKVNPNASFLESFKAKTEHTIVNDINKTDVAVSIYVRQNGEVECFYNYVHATIDGKEYKPKNKNRD